MLFKIINTYKLQGLKGLLIRIIRYPFYKIIRAKAYKEIFKNTNPKNTFTNIYKYNWWGSEESISGVGSTIENTEEIRNNLSKLFFKYKIKTIFDGPCGDFNWMKILLAKHKLYYIGWDIVDEVIEANKYLYSNTRTKFEAKSIMTCKVPKADIWLCRDCFIHFSYLDIHKTLQNFLKSNIPYILFSTYKNDRNFKNHDIQTGDARVLNFFIFPFDFKQNFDEIIKDDKVAGVQKYLVMFSREEISKSIDIFYSNIKK